MNRAAATPYSYVFDLGNVLIRWDPRHLYRKVYGADAKAMEWFLANVCTPAWNEKQDAGRSFAEGIAELLPMHPDHAREIRLYFERWDEMLNGAIDENVEILAELKRKGVPVYALSNWSAETFGIAEQRFPFLKWFDGIVLSAKERRIKPDPEIYKILLERYGLNPNKTVFIDDSKTNILAARDLGMVGIHFAPGSQLKSLLLEAGVLGDR